VESEERTDKIYRPLKGMASLHGAPDLIYRNPTWNDKKAELSHELMGKVEEVGGSFIVKTSDALQRAENSRYHGINQEDIFIIFGEEDVSVGTFEIEIKADQGREIILGIFSSRIPKEVYISDETHPPKEWNVENIRPFLWKLKDGKSWLEEKEYPDNVILDNEKQIRLNENEFNRFTYTNDGKKLCLSVNGEKIHEIELPFFHSLHTVVSDTDQEVIIKLVNMAEQEDMVSINLDCEVADEYQCYLLTGEKRAENSFANPENIHDEELLLKGAAQKFVYMAPPLSVSVLRLAKK
jgi:hypothetical protein